MFTPKTSGFFVLVFAAVWSQAEFHHGKVQDIIIPNYHHKLHNKDYYYAHHKMNGGEVKSNSIEEHKKPSKTWYHFGPHRVHHYPDDHRTHHDLPLVKTHHELSSVKTHHDLQLAKTHHSLPSVHPNPHHWPKTHHDVPSVQPKPPHWPKSHPVHSRVHRVDEHHPLPQPPHHRFRWELSDKYLFHKKHQSNPHHYGHHH